MVDLGALSGGRSRGLDAGTIAGERQGRRRGSKRGAVAGKAAVRDAVKARAKVGGAEAEAHGASLTASGEVLVIGDSLEVLSSPSLQRYLPSAKLTINAEGGYSSIQLFELFQESYDPSQSVIVFDAGTNDNPAYPQILASRLQAVANAVGDRCMVVPTIHGLPVNGINSAGKNRVVKAFAASRPGTQVPDWANAVAAQPELMQSDNLHPIADGAQLRAQLIAQGVRACLEFNYGFGLDSKP